LRTRTHPSGITETLYYNNYGYFSYLSLPGLSQAYLISNMNARGQITSAQYNYAFKANTGYDAYGFPSSSSGSIFESYYFQKFQYTFDPVTGNLLWRKDLLKNRTEDFTYDNLDRLTGVSGPASMNITYAANGNITGKSDIGTEFLYEAIAKPYALTRVTCTTGAIPSVNQSITYTSFNKISTISEDTFSASFIYNSEHERIRMIVKQNGNTILTRWYSGGSYIKEVAGSDTSQYTFIGGDAYSAPIIAITRNNSTSYYALLRDYLGNLTQVVAIPSNTPVATYSYDAWGRRRNPDNWSYALSGQPELIAGRGFTGHEHLPWFQLIQMNGRMYDPLVGRFLSPDNFVQAPDFTQSFNRYSYCLNNPLKYTDPDGEWFLIDDAIAAAVGGVINLATNWKNIDNFWEGLGSFGAGAANAWLTLNLGPVGAAIGGGITGAVNNIIAQTGNGVGLKQVDWGKVGFNGLVGSASGIAGYGAGQFASKYIGGVIVNGFNITSPVLKTTISGAIGGAAGGYVGGYTGGYLMTGNPSAAHQAGMSGLKMGAGIGAATGFAGGLKYCHDNNINPWTGVRNNSVTIGEGMYRVDLATKDLGNSNINKDWPADMDAYYDKPSRMINPNAMEFNGQWIEIQMNNEVYIYDIGTPKGGPVTSPYYNMEVARTMIYPNVVPVRYIHYQHTIRILIISR